MAKKTGHSIPDQPESWRWPEKQWRDIVNKIRAGKSLKPDVYLTAAEKEKDIYTSAIRISREKRIIFTKWQLIRAYQFIKGLRCKPVS